MRPQITFPKSLSRALNYHEKKVQKGTAELIHAHGFYQSAKQMSFYDKKDRFGELMQLNDRSENKLIHISLNFHPSETGRLDKAFLIHLADQYMHKIGFGDQPYLVYKHEDAGHPHIHVLSSLIKEDGSHIKTQYIGKNVSEPVRKEMEKQYGFIPADKKDQKEQQRENHTQLVITPQKIQAGKSATVRSITNLLDHVINQYNYTSIHELNTILKLYNVKADRGAEDGRIYRNKGLTYVVIDENGNAVTKPVKASSFHNKPTLAILEEKFKENTGKREPAKKHTKNAIEWAFRAKPATLGALAKLLQKERIDMVVRRSEQGQVFGITYINHEKKAVFNGGDLDKAYAAKRLLERLRTEQKPDLSIGLDERNERHQAKNTELPKPVQETLQAAEGRQKGNRHSVQPPEAGHNTAGNAKEQMKSLRQDSEISSVESKDESPGKLIEQLVGVDYVEGAINKDLLTEEQRKKKRGLNKQWEI